MFTAFLILLSLILLGTTVVQTRQVFRLQNALKKSLENSLSYKEKARLFLQLEKFFNGAFYVKKIKENKYTYFNSFIEEMTGYKPDEFTSDHWRAICDEYTIWKDHRVVENQKDEYTALFSKEKVSLFIADFRLRKKNGEHVWLNDRSVPFRKGGQLYSLGILTEISDRKAIEILANENDKVLKLLSQLLLELLRSGHQSLEADVQKCASITALMFDFHELVIGVLPVGSTTEPGRLIHYPGETHDSISPEETVYLRGLFRKPTTRSAEYLTDVTASPAVPDKWKNSAYQQLFNEEELLGFVAIRFKDSASVKAAVEAKHGVLLFEVFTILLKKNHDFIEKTTQQRYQADRKKYEAIGMICEGICHEFNNQFQGILWNLDFLLESTDRKEQLEIDQSIRKSLQTATDITKKMAIFAGSRNARIENVSLGEFLREELVSLQHSHKDKVTILVENAVKDAACQVSCVRFELLQVFAALLNNAEESMSEISPLEKKLIRLSISQEHLSEEQLTFPQQLAQAAEGDYIVFRFTDTGVGIPPENLEKVFDPFFSTKFVGRGMGLSFVLGFVRTHKGSLKIQSVPNYGTTVTVCLPASKH